MLFKAKTFSIGEIWLRPGLDVVREERYPALHDRSALLTRFEL